METQIVHPFDELMLREDEDIRLAEAALLFAADHCPDLEPRGWLERLDALARRVERMEAASPEDQVDALRAVLVEEEGLAANAADYYDPRNSFLNEVLERRLGIPISLSVIWLDICRQLNWPFVGVGLPGHFIIKRHGRNGELLIDPYGGGRILSRQGCERLVSHLFGRRLLLDESAFEPIGIKPALTRMLNNLYSIFTRREEWSQAACVLTRMLAIAPDSELIRDQLARVGVKIAELN